MIRLPFTVLQTGPFQLVEPYQITGERLTPAIGTAAAPGGRFLCPFADDWPKAGYMMISVSFPASDISVDNTLLGSIEKSFAA